MIDKLFFVVLVLNATGLFSFMAPQLGVSIGQVSLVLLGLNVLYLVAKACYVKAIFRQGSMRGWLFIMLIWPLLTIAYTPSFEVREIGLLFYYFTLFAGAVVYTAANGLSAVHRVMAVSLVITVIGLVLSMMMPQYFEAVSELADAEAFTTRGRAFGFFLQPNSLAINMVFLFIGWFALWKRKNALLELAAITALLFLMLLTGSRTGILIAIIIVCMLGYSWRKTLTSAKYLLKIIAVILCVAAGIFVVKSYLAHNNYTDIYENDLIARVEMMLEFRLSNKDNLMEEGSVGDRRLAQEAYWALIYEKPFLGHGFGSENYYYENDVIFKTAHSDALAYAMKYGVLYPIAFCLLVLRLYRTHKHSDYEGVIPLNSVFQFVVILILLFMVAGQMLNDRTLYVVWGMFYAAVYRMRLLVNNELGETSPALGRI